MIRLNNISKSYQNHQFVVKDVNLTINDGETLVLLGESGCGKTTILKMINRLIEPTSGCIELDQVDIETIEITELRRSMGYAFQGVGLFPHMTVYENITLLMQLEKHSDEQCMLRATQLLEMVNLDPHTFLKRYPDELSGGQKQRVGVARALAGDKKYLLMDEPFGALDAINRDGMQAELCDLKRRLDKTIVFVTHDIFEAMRVGDRIAVMNKGCLEQVGTVDDMLNHPQTQYVEMLFKTMHDQVNQFSEQLS